MKRERCSGLSLGLAVLAALLACPFAQARESEAQLLVRIQSESSPVKKAKDEIKLAQLKLAQAQTAYSQGHVDAGARLVGALVDALKSSWKFLQESGRKASKHPDGFRELDIALRENVRSLQDLGRTVNYFDRTPLTSAAQQLDQEREEVLHELFPPDKARNTDESPQPPQTPKSQIPAGAI
jgi:hypothetical protein